MKKTLLKTLVTVSLTCALAPAFAYNVNFLENSALSKMTEEDLGVLRAAARNALDYGADGQSRRWENAQTGATGVVTPLDTFPQDGMHCRRLELFNEAGGVSGRSIFVFCRQPDGSWKYPPGQAAKPAASK